MFLRFDEYHSWCSVKEINKVWSINKISRKQGSKGPTSLIAKWKLYATSRFFCDLFRSCSTIMTTTMSRNYGYVSIIDKLRTIDLMFQFLYQIKAFVITFNTSSNICFREYFHTFNLSHPTHPTHNVCVSIKAYSYFSCELSQILNRTENNCWNPLKLEEINLS